MGRDAARSRKLQPLCQIAPGGVVLAGWPKRTWWTIGCGIAGIPPRGISYMLLTTDCHSSSGSDC
jgi:hypothetical protein